MNRLTFASYMSIVNEDIQPEIDKLRADLAMVDASIEQRTRPLLQRKEQINKMLAIKLKQQQAELARAPTADQQRSPAPTQGSQVSTPGSSGAATPGSSG